MFSCRSRVMVANASTALNLRGDVAANQRILSIAERNSVLLTIYFLGRRTMIPDWTEEKSMNINK